MQTNSYDPTMAEGKDTGDVAINPKMGGACKKCGGILLDNSCQSCGATQKQETQESYTIDKKAHRGAQKAAKIRNLAKGATNAGEKAAAEKKAKGPKLFGERALTKGEEDEKEKNVKGMKKSFSDFKKRYGDDAKSVMYATATKMAKEESEIDEASWDKYGRPKTKEGRAAAARAQAEIRAKDKASGRRPYGSKMGYARKKFDEDTELDERTRYAKETGKDFKTGNPSEKGGKEPSPAMKSTKDFMRKTGGAMSARGKAIAIRGKKKEKGAKPKFKSGPTPVDKIKGQLAKKRAPKPSIGSRFD